VAEAVPQSAVQIAAAGVLLDGDLAVPSPARGVVLFAHGSGSSRHSPRNRRVAAAFQQARYATLLMDLLTGPEEDVDARTRQLRFDIPRLAARLTGAVDWLAARNDLGTVPIALFGASTGAAAAVMTAAERVDRVRLVISRGGRPDLAGAALPGVQAPVLLIVGGKDREVHQLNVEAARRMNVHADIVIIPGASHLFEEPGTLDAVIDTAVDALRQHLP
jgi:putative phosphoribosyl transferase